MSDHHDDAMRLAADAGLLLLEGRAEAAREKLVQAAELEQRAADDASPDRPRTRGILRISAISLWLQAGMPTRGIELAERYLAEPLVASFAREIDELCVECRNAERAARSLPTVSEDFVAKAREREDAFAERRVPSGSVADVRTAA